LDEVRKLIVRTYPNVSPHSQPSWVGFVNLTPFQSIIAKMAW
jgi:hypothetical protein